MKYLKPPMLSMNFSENKEGMKNEFQISFLQAGNIAGKFV